MTMLADIEPEYTQELLMMAKLRSIGG